MNLFRKCLVVGIDTAGQAGSMEPGIVLVVTGLLKNHDSQLFITKKCCEKFKIPQAMNILGRRISFNWEGTDKKETFVFSAEIRNNPLRVAFTGESIKGILGTIDVEITSYEHDTLQKFRYFQLQAKLT